MTPPEEQLVDPDLGAAPQSLGAQRNTVLEIRPPENPHATDGAFLRLMQSPLGNVVPVIAAILLWELGSQTGIIDRTFFPPPHRIVAALGELLADGVIGREVGITLQRIGYGFLFGAVPGVALGVLMARVRWVGLIIDPLISATYPIPMIAVLPLLLVIFGLGSPPIIALSAIICFYPIIVNTVSGVRHVDERLINMARNMGAGRRQVLWKIALPAALPSIFAGLRLGVGLALLGAVAGEFVAASEGIGARTWRYWQIYQIQNMYATLVVIAGIGFILMTGTVLLERRMFRWSEASSRS